MKATKEYANTISKRLDAFADIEHVKFIREELLPRIADFAAQVDHLLDDNDKVK